MDESSPGFTVFDVLGDAWRSFRRTWTSHAGWNAGFMAFAVLTTCLLSCVLFGFAGVAGAALGGGGDDEVGGGVAIVIVALIYVGMLVAFFALFALHQGVSVAIAAHDLRGEPVELRECVGEGTARLGALAGAMFGRLAADFVVTVPVTAIAIGAGVASGGLDGSPPSPERIQAMTSAMFVALGLGYPVMIVWWLIVRAFLGLSGPAVQVEGLGGFAALRRSVELLAGRRLQLVGLRLLWLVIGVALYGVTYAPMLALTLVASRAPELAILNLVVLPYALLWYYFAMHLYSFDSVLEAAYHARVTKGQSREDIADVFA
jgi:hypothetical protein